MNLETSSGVETLWKASPPAEDPTRYNLSQFAIQLNELTPGLQQKLPPTDCRLRPDQSSLEQGYFDRVRSSSVPDRCSAPMLAAVR
jgi:oxysterol-binding protein 1